MTTAGGRGETRTTVGSIHIALTPTDEALAVTHAPPWACAVEVFPGLGAAAAVSTVATDALPDVTILIENRSGSSCAEAAAAVRMVREQLPTSEILLFEPGSVLRFLWCFLDEQDPMALARAADRTLFDESYFHRPIPEFRSGRRANRRKAIREVVRLLRRMGSALGVDLPFPRGEREESSWGLSRTCGLIEAGLGLYAGLLRRWGSPLPVVREQPDGLLRVTLMDRWLRENDDSR